MLDGFRVLDLTDEKGQLCARILGDLGADVIKVEPPRGDPSRRLGPFYHDAPDPESSLNWFAYNSNKRSITLDLETADGREVFKTLASTADLLVESTPPGYMESVGLGYDDLSPARTGLVMTSITPYGQTGPDKLGSGTDLILMARGGLLNICGETDGPPARIAVSQSYCQAGGQAAMASVLALHQRDQTGSGQHIDLSMQEAVANSLISVPMSWDMIQFEEGRGTRQLRGKVIGRYSWPCSDGHVNWCWWVAPGWGRKTYPLLEWMAEEEAVEDLWDVDWENKSTAELTQEEVDHWEDLFGKFFMQHTKRQIYEKALKHRIMLFPTFTLGDLATYSQLQERRYYTPVRHDELSDTIAYAGPFVVTSNEAWSMRRRPPLIGEHNAEVYVGEMGFCRSELAALKVAGAV